MSFSQSTYPQTYRYIESLPAGLDSYPECLGKTDARESIRTGFKALGEDRTLPPALLRFFDGDYREAWMPEVVSVALQLAVRDACFKSDADFLDWCADGYRRLYRRPHYRVLMLVLSPSVLVMGATKKWGAFHQGSTLTTLPLQKASGRISASARLQYPRGLFPRLLADVQREAYFAALTALSATNGVVEVVEAGADEARFHFAWDAA